MRTVVRDVSFVLVRCSKQCIAAVITIALVFCRLDYMVELQGARVFVMSSAVIATAAAVEIGKKGENMAWHLLAHHVAIVCIILYAFDRLIWCAANYLQDADNAEFAAFLMSDNIFAKLPKYPRASVEMIIKYAQLQVLGTALEIPTSLARLHDAVKKYAARYEPTWQASGNTACDSVLLLHISLTLCACACACACMQDYLPTSRSMHFASFLCWLLLKVVFVPAFTIYLLADYAPESSHIPFTYYTVVVTQVIFWLASLWVCRVLWIRYEYVPTISPRISTQRMSDCV